MASAWEVDVIGTDVEAYAVVICTVVVGFMVVLVTELVTAISVVDSSGIVVVAELSVVVAEVVSRVDVDDELGILLS